MKAQTTQHILVCVLFLVSVQLAGCFQAAPASDPGPILAGMATYAGAEGKELSISVVDWAPSVAADLQPVTALLVKIEQEQTEPQFFRILPNGTLLNSEVCNMYRGGACSMVLVRFSATDVLGPLGVGWSWSDSDDIVKRPRSEDGSERTISRSNFFSPWFAQMVESATVSYSSDLHWPTTFVYRLASGEEAAYELRTASTTSALQDVEHDLPRRPNQPPLPIGDVKMFAGETVDDFDRGLSHLDSLEGLRQASESASTQLSEGCVVRYSAWYYENNASDLVSGLVSSQPTELFEVDVLHSGDQISRWRYHRYDDRIPEYQVHEEQQVESAGKRCPTAAPAERFRITSATFEEKFNRLEPTFQPPLNFRFEHHTIAPGNRAGPADWFSMNMVPPHVDPSAGSVGYLPYSLVVSANTGLVEYMYIHPEDALAMQPRPS